MTEPVGENFLLEEYRALQEAFNRNEELGERRVSILLTLVGAVVAGLTAGFLGEDRHTASGAAMVGFSALLLLGLSTLARVIHRNLRSSEYLRAAATIREYFGSLNEPLKEVLPFKRKDNDDGPWRKREWKEIWFLRTGGIVETVEIVVSLIAAGLGAAISYYISENSAALAVGAGGGFSSSYFFTFAWVKHRYDKAYEKAHEKKSSA